MKILMIRPRPSAETIGLQHVMIVEPLELEILASQRRDCDEVIVTDMIIEKKPLSYFLHKHKPDLLCLTGYITHVHILLNYCRIAKSMFPNIVTAIGGVHCEVCPEDFDNSRVDYRFVRNAAVNFRSFLDHLDGLAELPLGILPLGEDLAYAKMPPWDFHIPFADRSSVAHYRKHYFYIFNDKVALLKTSFGCPYQCNFCFCRVITQGSYFQRPMDEVMDELESIREKEIYIVDDDFLADQKRLELFVSEVEKRNIRKHYLVYGRADFIARHPETMHQLALIGLKTVIVGFESFSDNDLERYNKNSSVSLYAETMNVLNKEKIEVYATIILPPEWDRKDFDYMVKVLKSLGIHYVNLQPLTPLPKTGVEFPEDELLISRSEYEKWDLAHLALRPAKLSVPDYYREILKAYSAVLYQPGVLWKYLTQYSPRMLYKMISGANRVASQYKQKIRKAEQDA